MGRIMNGVAGVAGFAVCGALLPLASATGRPEVPHYRSLVSAVSGAQSVDVSCSSVTVSGTEAKGFDGMNFKVSGLAKDNSILYTNEDGDAKMFSVTGKKTRSWYLVSENLPYFLAASGPKADYTDATDMDASMWQMLSPGGAVDVEASDIIVSCTGSEATMSTEVVSVEKTFSGAAAISSLPQEVATDAPVTFDRLLQDMDLCPSYTVSGAEGLDGTYYMDETMNNLYRSENGGYVTVTTQNCTSGLGGLDGAEEECLQYVVYLGSDALDYAYVTQADASDIMSEVLASVWRIDFDCTMYSFMYDFEVSLPTSVDAKLDECTMFLSMASDIMMMCDGSMAPTSSPTSSPTLMPGETLTPTISPTQGTRDGVSPASSALPAFFVTAVAVVAATCSGRWSTRT